MNRQKNRTGERYQKTNKLKKNQCVTKIALDINRKKINFSINGVKITRTSGGKKMKAHTIQLIKLKQVPGI